MSHRTGGQILVDQLVAQGVDRVFCVPGESYLAVLDAFHDSPLDVVVCRQEGGAAMMAEADAKLTGRPGICFATRGPGATNASAGVHVAKQDSTPMILFVGQVARGMRGREAFQELDYRAVFGSMAKWTTEVDDATRIPEIVSRAFHTALSGRPGPVVVALPEDMLTEIADVADARPVSVPETYPSASQAQQLARMIEDSSAPLIILGGSRWHPEASAAWHEFALRAEVPVACSFRRQSLFDHLHPGYVGEIGLGSNPALLEAVRKADLIVLAGGRFSEVPSQGYTLVDIPRPRQKLVHIHSAEDELGSIYAADLAIHGTPNGMASVLRDLQVAANAERAARTAAMHASYLEWSDTARAGNPGRLQMAKLIDVLRSELPSDTIFTNGAGNFSGWLHRHWRHRHPRTQVAPLSGTMGYSMPSGVAAKLRHPDRTVITFAGDGDFLMNGQELATAIQYGAPVVIVVVDNGMYGTIRMHQEREYPGRVSATALRNPDFAGYARVFGGHGEKVIDTHEFAPALRRALGSGLPAIIHCVLDVEAISSSATLSSVRRIRVDDRV